MHADASSITHHAGQWLKESLPRFAPDLRARSFRDGTLVIECGNSVAAQECQQQIVPLLDHLRKTCGHTMLQAIRLVRERTRKE